VNASFPSFTVVLVFARCVRARSERAMSSSYVQSSPAKIEGSAAAKERWSRNGIGKLVAEMVEA